MGRRGDEMIRQIIDAMKLIKLLKKGDTKIMVMSFLGKIECYEVISICRDNLGYIDLCGKVIELEEKTNDL